MRPKVSVAMATYNGEKYIKEQIESILASIGKEDEIIIYDDDSKDETIKIINNYMKNDNRIKLINGPKCGIIKNFENAIKNCKRKIYFFI